MIRITATVTLARGREGSVRRLHPWIFSGAIKSMDGSPVNGDWVEVNDSGGKTIGYGHFQRGSIAIRLLSFSTERPGDSFYADRLKKASELRSRTVIRAGTNCYRLVNAEGDGLSGLIIDMYNGVAVVQAHSDGMFADRALIADSLREICQDLQTIYFSNSSGENEVRDYLFGMSALPHIVSEHGRKFYVDWETGQKTGFFLDQRENRLLAANLFSGRRVLNTFCYTGGFSVYALSGGASLVHSVDSSQKAIELAMKNLELNNFDPALHECFTEDVFGFLKNKPNVYDAMVLDPPAFAKHKSSKHQAMKGYQRLNAEAFRVLRPGSIVLTFSCSQVVNRQLFYDTVVSAAILANREIKVLYHLSQPADHPVSIFHPEGEYLKGLCLYIE